MAKEPAIEMEGIVIETLPNAEFIVEILPESKEDKKENDEENDKGKPARKKAENLNQHVGSQSKHKVKAHISGKMRMHYIKINPGDRVTVEVSPYDPTRGRITYRNK